MAVKMTPIRKAAKGRECQVRLPRVCSGVAEKSVLAHKNGAGMARKERDFIAAFCCSDCHAVVDGGVSIPPWLTKEEVQIAFYEGIFRTQEELYQEGLIVIPSEKDRPAPKLKKILPRSL